MVQNYLLGEKRYPKKETSKKKKKLLKGHSSTGEVTKIFNTIGREKRGKGEGSKGGGGSVGRPQRKDVFRGVQGKREYRSQKKKNLGGKVGRKKKEKVYWGWNALRKGHPPV